MVVKQGRRFGLSLRHVARDAAAAQRVEGVVAHRDGLGKRAAEREHEVVQPWEYACSRCVGGRVPEVGDDRLHELGEDLRRAAPAEVEGCCREVLDAARGLDREREVLLVPLVDAHVVVGIGQVDGPHEVALVQRPAKRCEAAKTTSPLDAVVVEVLEVEHKALLAVVLDHEGLGDVVEAGRTGERACEEAAVALGRQPLAVLRFDPGDALVERRGRAVRPIDAYALANPAKHVRRGAHLAPERDVLAHALLQRGQPRRSRRRRRRLWRRRSDAGPKIC